MFQIVRRSPGIAMAMILTGCTPTQGSAHPEPRPAILDARFVQKVLNGAHSIRVRTWSRDELSEDLAGHTLVIGSNSHTTPPTKEHYSRVGKVYLELHRSHLEVAYRIVGEKFCLQLPDGDECRSIYADATGNLYLEFERRLDEIIPVQII